MTTHILQLRISVGTTTKPYGKTQTPSIAPILGIPDLRRRIRSARGKARPEAAMEKLRQAARNLKAMNLTSGQIAAATGLTADEKAGSHYA